MTDSLVFGMPDERYAQRVVAVVDTNPGAELDVDDLRAELHSQLAGYKVPREIKVVQRVPRTPVGKADYGAARELLSPDG